MVNSWQKRFKLWLWLTIASLSGGNLAVWFSFHHLPKRCDDVLAACVSTAAAVGIIVCTQRNTLTKRIGKANLNDSHT